MLETMLKSKSFAMLFRVLQFSAPNGAFEMIAVLLVHFADAASFGLGSPTGIVQGGLAQWKRFWESIENQC